MPRTPFTIIQDSEDEDDGNLTWTQAAGFGNEEHEIHNSSDRDNDDEAMYGFNEDEELGLAVPEDEDDQEVGELMENNGGLERGEESAVS
ncbi:hypothetical protein BJ508DRAFT_409948 [Ascobolus immersus RN42]|uniref:Uncharacterized protein n=1 Tax=Ascobolus immersus RN42 TaxID=1160509 RepID=A0A3N4IPB9_ASCIM|nr:hypothetical protein BJ508DRAFT_409948 [Ascobolus immersus RN42]